jgi:nucleoside-diphosphate-sugar epimerase
LIPPHPPLFDDGDNHPDPRPHYVPDTHRARTDLDLCIEVPLKEAIRKTIADYRIEKGG